MLGDIIKDLRIQKGLSQPKLAELVGVSNGMISIWENNLSEPRASLLRRLAIVFDVTSDYLLGLEDECGVKIR